jgi:hypothetical protein
MTVSFYIPRREDGEKGFQHTFERNAAVEIANAFQQTYGDTDALYALVFNPDDPPADMIVITENGVGVVDFKHITGSVSGTIDTTWTIHAGSTHKHLQVSNRFKNPFDQVRTYRLNLYHKMKGFARGKAGQVMPSWMQENGQFHLQAAVCFTDDCEIKLDLDPNRTKPWFEAILQNKLPQWAYTLTFTSAGGREPMNEEQINALCQGLLDVSPWTSVQNLVAGSEVFGYLKVYDATGQSPTNYPLTQMVTTIGREVDNDIPIGANGVSRHHARIVRTEDEILIEDLNSTNGTWLNTKRLEPNEPKLMHEGDNLVFGPVDNGRPQTTARRARFSTRLSSSPETQIFYRV